MSSDKTLSDVAAEMRGIDIAILSTYAENGYIAGRPMSNNGDVEYNGKSFYFTYEDSHTVGEIEREPKIGLGFAGKGKIYITVEGDAELIRDKSAFAAHWTPDLDKWFEQGIESPEIVMIEVTAKRIHWWDGMQGGQVKI
jgi:general stress protein 26